MCVIILLRDTFVLWLTFNVLVRNLLKDFGEDPGSWTHINSTSTRNAMRPILIISTPISHPH